MRRFNSLMSKPGVGITLSPPKRPTAPPFTGVRSCYLASPSTGDDGTVTGTAQDRADRSRLGNREYDDRQRRLAGKRESGRIHDLVAAFDRLRMGQAVKSLGGRVFFAIGAIDAVDIGGLQHGLGADFGG